MIFSKVWGKFKPSVKLRRVEVLNVAEYLSEL